MSGVADEIVEHRPERCDGCGAQLHGCDDRGYQRRQVIDLPEVKPRVTEHRAHTYGCGCGQETTAAFPAAVRAPVSYGPRVRAVVAYLLGRQHIPNRRAAEAMADLFDLDISSGAVDSIYADAGRRLKVFVVALVALLKSLPVLHVDETSDRIGTTNCWMHVVSTSLYTLIHASLTRGEAAIDEAGVLKGSVANADVYTSYTLQVAAEGTRPVAPRFFEGFGNTINVAGSETAEYALRTGRGPLQQCGDIRL